MKITSETRCCVECGKPLPLESSIRTKFCGDCLREHHKASAKTYYWEHKADVDASAAETYHWYKERGICVSCHSEKVLVFPDGKKSVRCARCLALGQKAQKKQRKKKKA